MKKRKNKIMPTLKLLLEWEKPSSKKKVCKLIARRWYGKIVLDFSQSLGGETLWVVFLIYRFNLVIILIFYWYHLLSIFILIMYVLLRVYFFLFDLFMSLWLWTSNYIYKKNLFTHCWCSEKFSSDFRFSWFLNSELRIFFFNI